jgi:carbon monoxide dehydrogenase subunit G
MVGGNDKAVDLKKEGRGLLAQIDVAATPERVWQVLTSFEEMAAHLSSIEESRILKQEGNYRLVEQAARAENSLLPLSFRVVLDVVEEKPFLHFTQQAGSSAPISGYWRVEPDLAEGGSCIRWYLEVNAKVGLKRWAVERHLKSIIVQNLKDLATWIEK